MMTVATPLVGRVVQLRGVSPEDSRYHAELLAEDDSGVYLDVTPPPQSSAAIEDWTSWLARGAPSGPNRFFQIDALATGEHVGGITTHSADPVAGSFGYGIHIRQAHRGPGYAQDAIVVCLRFHWVELRFESAHVYVFENNLASMRLHERIGFSLTGSQRRSAFYGGEFLDVLKYSITKEAFLNLHGE